MLFSSKLDSTVINAWIIGNDHLAWDRRATLTIRSSKPQRRTAPARSDVAKRTMRVAMATVVRASKQFSRASKRTQWSCSLRNVCWRCSVLINSILFYGARSLSMLRSLVWRRCGAHHRLHWKCTLALQEAESRIITKAHVTELWWVMDRVLAALNAAVQQHSWERCLWVESYLWCCVQLQKGTRSSSCALL